MAGPIHQLHVDHSERQSALLSAVHRSGTFNVRMVRLDTGDYLIDLDDWERARRREPLERIPPLE